VFLPTWPIDRLRRRLRLGAFQPGRRREPAILLVREERSKQLVACACSHSHSHGVQAGMTLAHARALLGQVPVIEAAHEPERDAMALHRLASWAMRFTPLVAPDPADGLLLDVSGCEQLYHSERRMLNAIGNALDRLGFANRLCCAGTIGCAWAVARFGTQARMTIATGDELDALAPLPIEALRVDTETIDALHEVNVDRISQVLAISRLELATRFNPTLLQRMDQALGDSAEVIDAIEPGEPVIAERIFDGAVTNLEAMFIVTRELIDNVRDALVRQACGATQVELTITRLDATPIRIGCRLSRPSRDAAHLFSLLKNKVEAMNMGYGVERMALAVKVSQRVAHRQHVAFVDDASESPADRAAGELIDTLTHRLGADRAVRLRTVESHLPERSAVRIPAASSSESPQAAGALVDADRPSLLLTSPEAIDVMAVSPEGPPIWMRWRGAEHRIVHSIGPERIHPEWWRSGKDGSANQWRDYYKVQDESGRWLWIFRGQQAARWFAHGEWA
jgi:protein ImuB